MHLLNYVVEIMLEQRLSTLTVVDDKLCMGALIHLIRYVPPRRSAYISAPV